MNLLRNQNGITIIAVFFMLLILGAMGIAVSKLTVSQQLQSVRAIQVQQSYYAARSGMEWAVQRAYCGEYDSAIDICCDGTKRWSGTQLSNLDGTIQLPDNDDNDDNNASFTVTYCTGVSIPDPACTGSGELISISSFGNTERKLKFPTFSTKVQSMPIDTCGGYIQACTENTTLPDFPGEPNFNEGYSSFGGRTYSTNNILEPADCQDGNCVFSQFKLEGSSTVLTIIGPLKIYITDNFKMEDDSKIIFDTTNGAIQIYVNGDAKFEGESSLEGDFQITTSGSIQIEGNANVSCI